MGNKYECLLEIDKKTGKVVKEYDSIKAVTYRHAGYNYNSLKNAVGKKTAYKGYYYVWKTLSSDTQVQSQTKLCQKNKKKLTKSRKTFVSDDK